MTAYLKTLACKAIGNERLLTIRVIRVAMSCNRILTAIAIAAAAMLTVGCAGSDPRAPVRQSAPQSSPDAVERLRAAALEFERARFAGDALAMARAAAARKPIDRVLLMDAPAYSGNFLTALEMFSAARAAARGDGELLQSIEKIDAESTSALLDGLPGFAKRIRPPKPAARPIGESESLLGDGRPLPRNSLPIAMLPPNGSIVTIGARESLWMRAPVAAARTLFVYAESKAGVAVRLRIVDADRGTQVCVDAQAHGFLLCKWRVEAAATGVVELSNAGDQAVAVLIIAHQ